MNKIKDIGKKVLLVIRRLFNKLKYKFNSLSKKKKRIVLIVLAVIILLIVGLIIFFGRTEKKEIKFKLNAIYDIHPDQVRTLYANMVEVSCYGDLHFDIEINKEPTNVKDLNRNNLIDYVFSYLDKTNELNDQISASLFKKTERELFSARLNLISDIKNYGYGEYNYTLRGSKIVRKKRECTSDNTYVSYLYGYSWDEDALSMDVNVAYLKDGILYNFNDVKLGEYDGDLAKLAKLTQNTSYYRINYIKQNGYFKLDSVEWLSRS